jgi:hypothetical protein
MDDEKENHSFNDLPRPMGMYMQSVIGSVANNSAGIIVQLAASDLADVNDVNNDINVQPSFVPPVPVGSGFFHPQTDPDNIHMLEIDDGYTYNLNEPVLPQESKCTFCHQVAYMLSERDATIGRRDATIGKLKHELQMKSTFIEQLVNSLKRNGECCICYEPVAQIGNTVICMTCGHTVHKHCFWRWRNAQQASCPSCRSNNMRSVETMFDDEIYSSFHR